MKATIIKATALTMVLAAPYSAFGQDFVGWLDYSDGGDQWQRNKARLQAFGEEFDSAFEMYQFLERQAGGGEPAAVCRLILIFLQMKLLLN